MPALANGCNGVDQRKKQRKEKSRIRFPSPPSQGGCGENNLVTMKCPARGNRASDKITNLAGGEVVTSEDGK
jgi:hypothetical protein